MKGKKGRNSIMRDGGYITAREAASLVGVNPTTIYRLIQNDDLVGVKMGRLQYVKVQSLADLYSDVPPILDRIKSSFPLSDQKEHSEWT